MLRAVLIGVALLLPAPPILAYSTICDPRFLGTEEYSTYEAQYNPKTGKYEGVLVKYIIEKWAYDCQYVFGPGPEPYGDSTPIHLDGRVWIDSVDAGDPYAIEYYVSSSSWRGYDYSVLWSSHSYLGETLLSPGQTSWSIGGFPIMYIASGNTVVYLKACQGDEYCSGTRSYVTRTVRQHDGRATMTAYWPESEDDMPAIGATAYTHALHQKYVQTVFHEYAFEDNARIALLDAFAYVEWDARHESYWTHLHWVNGGGSHIHVMDFERRFYIGDITLREERSCPAGTFGHSPSVGVNIEHLWISTPGGIRRPAMVFGSTITLDGL